jgi:hypothetical protein
MNEYAFLLWFVIGFIPYHAEKRHQGDKDMLVIRALYWSLLIHSQADGNRFWKLHLPLIERVKSGVWAALERLRDE